MKIAAPFLISERFKNKVRLCVAEADGVVFGFRGDETNKLFGFVGKDGAILCRQGSEGRDKQCCLAFGSFDFPASCDETIDEDGGGDAQTWQVDAFAVFVRDDARAFVVGEQDVVEFRQEAWRRGCGCVRQGHIWQVEKFALALVAVGDQLRAKLLEGFLELQA